MQTGERKNISYAYVYGSNVVTALTSYIPSPFEEMHSAGYLHNVDFGVRAGLSKD